MGARAAEGRALSSNRDEDHFRRSRVRVGKDQSSVLAGVSLRGPLDLHSSVPRGSWDPQVRLSEGECGSGNDGF